MAETRQYVPANRGNNIFQYHRYDFPRAKQDTNWTWQAFGRELIISEDLDPIYTMLANADHLFTDNLLKRWLLAYWCYYNAGVASHIAESRDFYGYMLKGVGGAGKYPRGMERRYFYGNQAYKTIHHLMEYEPEEVVDIMTLHKVFGGVFNAVISFTGFGSWMGWKIADMAERVLHILVDFSGATLGIYKDPVQGAAMVRFGDWRHPITDDELQEEVDKQVLEFDDLLAPPFYDRPVNIQEVETNLCKFKAHYKHSYPMGNDTFHVREGLHGWGDLAQALLVYCPGIKPGHKGWGS